ncbi:MAG: hypothetical protein IMY67_12030 [Bacteroidetes bacterium]|nr:hypothetical protein [Bacteroidota bacterium]
MDKIKAIEILEALASGCSPTTGELLENESILNEREVIRALQMAIDELKRNSNTNSIVEIEEIEINEVLELLKLHSIRPTYSRITGFFLGKRKFKIDEITSNRLYGKYSEIFKRGELMDYFVQYFKDNNYTNRENRKNQPWKEIDFFKKATFNKLSNNAIQQLKDKINEIGIEKTENLSKYITNSRITYARAYESWSEKEIELLTKAIEYTNDLSILTDCFQRGKGSIESYGKKIIYNNQDN